MPARAEEPLAYQQSNSWTDALPVCRESAVGSATNQIYRDDGSRVEGHPYEDCSCHIRVENNDEATYLYGVFDGHEGTQAANFALQRMAAEILLDSELPAKNTDEEIKDVLRQAFIAVERSYWNSLDDKLAERTSVQCEIPEGLNGYEAYQKYPHLVNKLNQLNTELTCGTTAVVALIHKEKLFVANVGDSRALLCRTDSNRVLRVVQLSVDHDLNNEDELLRLSKLGLNTDKFRQGSRLGNQSCTRCIGNHLVKGGYRDIEDLAVASGEPVTAEPDIHGGITLDSSCSFLLLMSDGLYKSLLDMTGVADAVNKEIAQLVVQQFKVQATLTAVAQAVVDHVVRIHYDHFVNATGAASPHRDDITLLIRNFNFPMPNALSSPVGTQVRFNPIISTVPIEPLEEEAMEEEVAVDDANETEDTNTTSSTTTTNTSNTTDNTDIYNGNADGSKRISPYVDFSEFYRNVEIARRNGTLPHSLH